MNLKEKTEQKRTARLPGVDTRTLDPFELCKCGHHRKAHNANQHSCTADVTTDITHRCTCEMFSAMDVRGIVALNIQSERDELLRTVENMRARLESAREGNASLASELKATQAREIRELQTSADLERRVRELTRENDALSARIDDLQAQVRYAQAIRVPVP